MRVVLSIVFQHPGLLNPMIIMKDKCVLVLQSSCNSYDIFPTNALLNHNKVFVALGQVQTLTAHSEISALLQSLELLDIIPHIYYFCFSTYFVFSCIFCKYLGTIWSSRPWKPQHIIKLFSYHSLGLAVASTNSSTITLFVILNLHQSFVVTHFAVESWSQKWRKMNRGLDASQITTSRYLILDT